MNAAKTVTARFDPAAPATYTLTVRKTPIGPILGSVVSDPAGINCGLLCATASATFPRGTVVTLTTQNGLGKLQSWTGDCAGGGACVLTMDSDKSVVAHFSLLLAPTSSEPRPVVMPTIETTLSLPGGRGEVSAGGRTTTVGGETVPVSVQLGGGDILVEATVREGKGDGRWLFDLGNATGEPGTVTILSGEPLTVTPYSLVFRLKGRAGERVSFVLRSSRGNAGATSLPP
jgi:hypothetical protein